MKKVLLVVLVLISGCSGINFHAGANFVDEVKEVRVTHDRSFANRVSRAWDVVAGNDDKLTN